MVLRAVSLDGGRERSSMNTVIGSVSELVRGPVFFRKMA
jgi:hypothetical protein